MGAGGIACDLASGGLDWGASGPGSVYTPPSRPGLRRFTVRVVRMRSLRAVGLGRSTRRRPRSRSWPAAEWPSGSSKAGTSLCYHVYANTGSGDAINYSVCLATVAGQSWTSPALRAPATTSWACGPLIPRAGLEEQNVDAVVELILDAAGNDVTGVPAPPLGLRALPIAGGRVRVEWTYPGGQPSRQPLGFHVYLGTGDLLRTTPFPSPRWPGRARGYGCFSAELASLGDGSPRSIAVRELQRGRRGAERHRPDRHSGWHSAFRR